VTAEKLLPKDHGFGVQRVPLETRYFEAYNRDNVHLVDISETPLVRVSRTPACEPQCGLRFRHHHLFHRLRRHHRSVRSDRDQWDRGGELFDKWRDGPATFLGMMVHGSPNLLMRPARRAARRRPISARHRDRCQLVHEPAAAHVGPAATRAPNLLWRRRSAGARTSPRCMPSC